MPWTVSAMGSQGRKRRLTRKLHVAFLCLDVIIAGAKKSYHCFEMSPFTEGLKFSFACAAAAPPFRQSRSKEEKPLHQKYLSERANCRTRRSRATGRRRHCGKNHYQVLRGFAQPNSANQRSSDSATVVCRHCRFFLSFARLRTQRRSSAALLLLFAPLQM